MPFLFFLLGIKLLLGSDGIFPIINKEINDSCVPGQACAFPRVLVLGKTNQPHTKQMSSIITGYYA